MSFKLWLEIEYQGLFKFLSQEDPLSVKDIKKIKKFNNKEDYIKSMSRGGKKTELAAKTVASSPINSSSIFGEEIIEKIYPKQVVIPSQKFANIVRPERYIAFVMLKTLNPNFKGDHFYRLVSLYQGIEPLNKNDILNNYYSIVGSIVFQKGYITHVWIDNEYKNINLYGKMREFLRKYYGIIGGHPEDNLVSKSAKAAEAKHKWNRFHRDNIE